MTSWWLGWEELDPGHSSAPPAGQVASSGPRRQYMAAKLAPPTLHLFAVTFESPLKTWERNVFTCCCRSRRTRMLRHVWRPTASLLPSVASIHPASSPESLFIIIELHSWQPIKQDILFLTTCSSPSSTPFCAINLSALPEPLKAFWLLYNGGQRGVRGATGLCAQEQWCLSIRVGSRAKGRVVVVVVVWGGQRVTDWTSGPEQGGEQHVCTCDYTAACGNINMFRCSDPRRSVRCYKSAILILIMKCFYFPSLLCLPTFPRMLFDILLKLQEVVVHSLINKADKSKLS